MYLLIAGNSHLISLTLVQVSASFCPTDFCPTSPFWNPPLAAHPKYSCSPTHSCFPPLPELSTPFGCHTPSQCPSPATSFCPHPVPASHTSWASHLSRDSLLNPFIRDWNSSITLQLRWFLSAPECLLKCVMTLCCRKLAGLAQG